MSKVNFIQSIPSNAIQCRRVFGLPLSPPMDVVKVLLRDYTRWSAASTWVLNTNTAITNQPAKRGDYGKSKLAWW